MEPPSWVSGFKRLRLLFWLFFIGTILYAAWVRNSLLPLHSDEIVQFEVAKTVDKANAIIQEWKDSGKYEQGVRSTSLAYVFIVLYTLSIGLGCRFTSACTGNEILIKGGRAFGWLILFAAICDVIENIVMSRILSGQVSQVHVTVVYNLARIKFSLVIVCLLFILVSALYWVIGKMGDKEAGFPRS